MGVLYIFFMNIMSIDEHLDLPLINNSVTAD